MPRKNSLKIYVEDGLYHLYNRGVEKRKIFLDEQDYKVFLFYLKKYLSPPELGLRPFKSLTEEVDLLTYCLMPNHFHLLVKQRPRSGITQLMNRISTCYGMYFNKRYDRVGSLFQGVYKAVRIETDEQLLHLSRYIHRNPLEEGIIEKLSKLDSYPYSSYADFLGLRKTKWIKPQEILSFFEKAKRKERRDFSYQAFVEEYALDDEASLFPLIIEA